MNLQNLGEALWAAILSAMIVGIAATMGFSVWASVSSHSWDFGPLPGGLVAAFVMSLVIAGPLVIMATTLFGIPAALIVTYLKLPRALSLVAVLFFAALPMMLIAWWLGDAPEDTSNGPTVLVIAYWLYAAPAAFTLWRKLMALRQPADTGPTLS
ncbi:hypothetical protein K3148_03600 [Qipengyuania aurantiaca]|uniref:Uncharacterized protein n=1 Tax=Qipengyuania aurantiaca TaxID=2867233 RepID=A0ABX8ZND3_9SPHN|nr:hypothetical protein [Qipengyuania aurantiaca]QZD90490.1 hypothetical protein K3148_03600 [Qipengyuania aurantiaca]